MKDIDKIIPDTMIMREPSSMERDEVCKKLALAIVMFIGEYSQSSENLNLNTPYKDMRGLSYSDVIDALDKAKDLVANRIKLSFNNLN